MKRQLKKLLIVTAALATVVSGVTPAAACGGRGGGGYGGFGGGFARPSVYRSASYAPSYSSYRQPTYSPPRVYNQPQYGFNQSQQVINQRQPVQQIAQPTPRATQASFQQQALQRQPVQQQPVQQRVGTPQSNVQQTSFQRTAQQQPAAPSRLTSVANNAAAQAPAASSTANAETSALKMLQSLGNQPAQATSSKTSSAAIPQFQAAPANGDQAHVGKWRVNLPNSQSVELVLQANGSFQWTAVSKGNQKSFNGQYRMESGRLTLVRSNDLQQMAGSWTGNTNQFTFKLDGANNGGLSFKRS